MEDRTSPLNQHAEWRNTQPIVVPRQFDQEAERDRLYQQAYDEASAEMWTGVDNAEQLADRIVWARAWIREHDHLLRLAEEMPEVCARWDAYREALETFLSATDGTVRERVLVKEAIQQGMSFAADVTAVHAAIASDDTIDPAEQLRILSGMHVAPLFDPPPVRPGCPPFCRTIHLQENDVDGIHSGDVTTFYGRSEYQGGKAQELRVAIRQCEGEDEPSIDLLFGDAELTEEEAFRLGVELIRRVGDLRRMRAAAAAAEGADLVDVPASAAGHEPGE